MRRVQGCARNRGVIIIQPTNLFRFLTCTVNGSRTFFLSVFVRDTERDRLAIYLAARIHRNPRQPRSRALHCSALSLSPSPASRFICSSPSRNGDVYGGVVMVLIVDTWWCARVHSTTHHQASTQLDWGACDYFLCTHALQSPFRTHTRLYYRHRRAVYRVWTN